MTRRAPDFEDLFAPGSGGSLFDRQYDQERGLERDPSLQPPTQQDLTDADRTIRRNIEAMPDHVLGVSEEYDGEAQWLEELHGPGAARQIMRDRAAQQLYDVADRTVSQASRQDFQRVRATQQEIDALWATFKQRHPDLRDADFALVEDAARRVIENEQFVEGPDLDPRAFMRTKPLAFVDAVADEVRYGVFDTDDGSAYRTNVTPGGGGGTPRAVRDEDPGSLVDELSRAQRAMGII